MAGPLTDIRWMAFQNVSSSLTIPAFAPMQVLGTTIKDGLTLVIECDQVGSAANPDFNLNIVFNGPVAIGPGGYGRCARGGDDCQSLWDTGTPSPGDVWGIKPGQFSLTKNGVGKFIVDGIVDSGTKRMYGRWEGINTFICTLGGTCSARSGTTPGSATGTICSLAGGVYTATSWTTTVYNSTKSTISKYLLDGVSTKYLQVKYISGLPHIDVDDCN